MQGNLREFRWTAVCFFVLRDMCSEKSNVNIHTIYILCMKEETAI